MTQTEKLEKRPQPDVYCPVCLGYGVKTLNTRNLEGKQATATCGNCAGTGWVKE